MKYLATVTHVLVTSRLNYCNVLHVGLLLKMTEKLQLVQNAAACYVGIARYQHRTSALMGLHCLPVALRGQFKVLIIIYKPLHGLGPRYVKDHLTVQISNQPFCSSGKSLLPSPVFITSKGNAVSQLQFKR